MEFLFFPIIVTLCLIGSIAATYYTRRRWVAVVAILFAAWLTLLILQFGAAGGRVVEPSTANIMAIVASVILLIMWWGVTKVFRLTQLKGEK